MYSVEFDNSSDKSLYVQLYEYLKSELAEGRIHHGERLPSLRGAAGLLGISITTVKQAYEQLEVEGYIESRPQSGFYAVYDAGADSPITAELSGEREARKRDADTGSSRSAAATGKITGEMYCDPASFDFVKWKKCMASVLNETPELLLTEGDRQGEPGLRREIADYLYRSRGVVCGPEQVVISAGTQQLVNHIARILKVMGIGHFCTEDPGYIPVRNIFSDWGFSLSSIPVRKDGIVIEKLPVNIRTAVYVSPQNQFPTGAVMPISRRHQILEWAAANDSIIIEDDYNSELRYFGMPVPALQGLDGGRRVVYIGSFTSTLFPAVRISYMVLPNDMAEIYESMKMSYDQTCSKTEQLTLALFMQRGFYSTNLKRIRNLYSRKLQEALDAIREYGGKDGFMTAENTQSGTNIIMKVSAESVASENGAAGFAEAAADLGIRVSEIRQLDRDGEVYLNFYYNQIPLEKMRSAVESMIAAFRNVAGIQ